ncbi:hypothetical protein AB4Y36_36415 [Paraburkholderia sp. BR10936]
MIERSDIISYNTLSSDEHLFPFTAISCVLHVSVLELTTAVVKSAIPAHRFESFRWPRTAGRQNYAAHADEMIDIHPVLNIQNWLVCRKFKNHIHVHSLKVVFLSDGKNEIVR